MIYSFSANSVNIPPSYFVDMNKSTLKFAWKINLNIANVIIKKKSQRNQKAPRLSGIISHEIPHSASSILEILKNLYIVK